MHELVSAKVNRILEYAKEAIRDDVLTIAEASRLTVQMIHQCVLAARRLSIPGDEKKQMVLQGVEMLYDVIIPALPLPIPRFVRKLVRPLIRECVTQAADGAIEAVYRFFYSEIHEIPVKRGGRWN